MGKTNDEEEKKIKVIVNDDESTSDSEKYNPDVIKEHQELKKQIEEERENITKDSKITSLDDAYKYAFTNILKSIFSFNEDTDKPKDADNPLLKKKDLEKPFSDYQKDEDNNNKIAAEYEPIAKAVCSAFESLLGYQCRIFATKRMDYFAFKKLEDKYEAIQKIDWKNSPNIQIIKDFVNDMINPKMEFKLFSMTIDGVINRHTEGIFHGIFKWLYQTIFFAVNFFLIYPFNAMMYTIVNIFGEAEPYYIKDIESSSNLNKMKAKLVNMLNVKKIKDVYEIHDLMEKNKIMKVNILKTVDVLVKIDNIDDLTDKKLETLDKYTRLVLGKILKHGKDPTLSKEDEDANISPAAKETLCNQYELLKKQIELKPKNSQHVVFKIYEELSKDTIFINKIDKYIHNKDKLLVLTNDLIAKSDSLAVKPIGEKHIDDAYDTTQITEVIEKLIDVEDSINKIFAGKDKDKFKLMPGEETSIKADLGKFSILSNDESDKYSYMSEMLKKCKEILGCKEITIECEPVNQAQPTTKLVIKVDGNSVSAKSKDIQNLAEKKYADKNKKEKQEFKLSLYEQTKIRLAKDPVYKKKLEFYNYCRNNGNTNVSFAIAGNNQNTTNIDIPINVAYFFFKNYIKFSDDFDTLSDNIKQEAVAIGVDENTFNTEKAKFAAQLPNANGIIIDFKAFKEAFKDIVTFDNNSIPKLIARETNPDLI